MNEVEEIAAPELTEDTVSVRAFSMFDIDTGVDVRWRGIRQVEGGACCYTDETDSTICDDTLSKAECDAFSGDFITGVTCDTDPCTGACCEDDGIGGTFCTDVSEADCFGTFQGVDTACSDDPDPCATGACCEDDGMGGFTCEELTDSECTTAGGTFQGIDVHCTDVPDPCNEPIGACCLGDGDCADITETVCTDDGGDYHGDGTTCADGGCGCTDPDACNFDPLVVYDDGSCAYPPGASLGCDISFASGSKCGINVGGTFYLSATTCEQYFPASGFGGRFCDNDEEARLDFFVSGEVTFFHDLTVSPSDCSVSDGGCYTDGGVVTVDRVQSGMHQEKCDDEATECQDNTFSPACGCFTCAIAACQYICGGPCGGITFSFPSTNYCSVSNEFTTAMLISSVEAKLPPFPGTFDEGGCASSRFLSSDEKTYSEQISQYKFFFPDGTTGFTVTWNEHFDGGGDTPMSASFPAHTTESGVYFLGAPSSNGTITITDINVTC